MSKQEIVVLVRCTWCMHVRKQWENPTAVVFIPSTLVKYAEMTCEHCLRQGLEIYVGELSQTIAVIRKDESMTEHDQSPMTREELVFELGRAHGLVSRLISNCELLLGTPNAETRTIVKADIEEARSSQREVWNRFYGDAQAK